MSELKLTYILSRLTPEQRNELCLALGISQETFYRRRNHPGDFTLDQGLVLLEFLQKLTGEEVDLFRLLTERVDVPMPARSMA